MKRCDPFPLKDEEIGNAAKMWGCTSNAEARRLLHSQRVRCQQYEDDDHEVTVAPINTSKMVQVVVRRKDGEKIEDHWQTLQRIKNDVLGANWFGYEVYPSQVYVIDTANAYHLWCTPYPFFHTYTEKEAESLR